MPPINANPAEVDKFSALASSWWDPQGDLKSLHDINPLRLDWIRSQAGPLGDLRVLDVGCGGGLLAEAMASEGAQVTGIDLARDSLQIARLHGHESGVQVHYECVSAEEYAMQQPGQFDLITCMELLEHVPDPASVVRACGQLVRPGGLVCFSTLNRNPKSFLLAIVAAEYVLRLLPRGTHQYEHFVTPSELAAAARAAGLEATALAGLGYQPWIHRYHLTGDTSVNYFLATRRPG
ncbi:MAG TPA: bifunctional 2-polyprenyl-6-hydroxyphenol methylase/3-demethylubiquinol 3-O-methyltransferase UbiG [Castellaniella sp.]|nr:bifunctional 2-polyprenyl-6-hydroxyphenol methylase/3-demethylubiquinol 3-O-methyltransferase UbiG [Castellaniella sp.]